MLGLALKLGLGLWFGLGGNVREGKSPGGMSDTPSVWYPASTRVPAKLVLVTSVHSQPYRPISCTSERAIISH